MQKIVQILFCSHFVVWGAEENVCQNFDLSFYHLFFLFFFLFVKGKFVES